MSCKPVPLGSNLKNKELDAGIIHFAHTNRGHFFSAHLLKAITYLAIK